MPRSKDDSALLLYADSENSADMYYFGGVFVPDPFIAIEHQGKKLAVVNQLEYARVGKEGRFDEVLSQESLLKEVSGKHPYPASVVCHLARKLGIRRFRLPSSFPVAVAFDLQAGGLKLDVERGLLFPEREFKTDAEAAAIRAGNRASAAGFRVVERLLKEAEIRKGVLYHGGRRLTSERVQEAIAVACLEKGSVAANTIVACGDQACDPHCRGTGPLRANSLIIVDIFPRVTKTGYHGDMTRTYLKGRASEPQKALYTAVYDAEQWAIGEHRRGKSAAKIYQAVRERFAAAGYPTKRENGVPVGFFHGLGHGLGLEVHEPPRVNPSGSRLRNGQVITVEPGLYYPGLGGARVEDVIRVRNQDPELLSPHPYRWQIR